MGRTIYIFPQGIGDGVMATAVAARYAAVHEEPMHIGHKHAELFVQNPAVVCHPEYSVQNLRAGGIQLAQERGDRLVALSYLSFRNTPDGVRMCGAGQHNMLYRMAARAGLAGPFEALPRLYLTPEEKGYGQLFKENQIAVMSQGIEQYKTWGREHMEAVMRAFPDCHFVQLGAAGDVPLAGAMNLCGRLTLRQTAAVLHHSRCLVGTQGALIHLARAVDCPPVILNPCAEPFPEMAYPECRCVRPDPLCPYCTRDGMFYADCAFPERCLEGLSEQAVIMALQEELAGERQALRGTFYEVESEPATDLADFHRQYDAPAGRLPALLVTRLGDGSSHVTNRSLVVQTDHSGTDLIQINRPCRLLSLQLYRPLPWLVGGCTMAIVRGGHVCCEWNTTVGDFHGGLKVSEEWLAACRQHLGVVPPGGLELLDGDVLKVTLRLCHTDELLAAQPKEAASRRRRLNVAGRLMALSRFYDNRWLRRLWKAGY